MQLSDGPMGGVNLIHPHKYHQAQKAAHLSAVINSPECLYSSVWKNQLKSVMFDRDPVLDRRVIINDLHKRKSTLCLIQAFECATEPALVKAGVDYRRRAYSVKELYRIFVQYDCPDRTPAMKEEEKQYEFSRSTAFANLRRARLSLRARSIVYKTWMKSLPKIYGPDSDACPRCILAPNEQDEHQTRESTIHLFVECPDTRIFADMISTELQSRCGVPFTWTRHRYFTLARRQRAATSFYVTLSGIFIYSTWIHRNSSVHEYVSWISDEEKKAAIALFFNELQKSANLT